MCGVGGIDGPCFTNQHLVLRHMKCEQIQQIVVGGCGLHTKQTRIGLGTRQVTNGSQPRNISEQFFDGVRLVRAVQRTDLNFKLARLLRCPGHHKFRRHRRSGHWNRSRCRWRSHRRHIAGHLARSQLADSPHQ